MAVIEKRSQKSKGTYQIIISKPPSLDNHGHTGQRTQKWQKVSGETSTLESSWRTTPNLFHRTKFSRKTTTVLASAPGGQVTTGFSSSTSLGGRDPAPGHGEVVLVRTQNFQLSCTFEASAPPLIFKQRIPTKVLSSRQHSILCT